ncbi:hypothetical protein FKM82_011961 [Ascaphus truei]
MNIHKKKWQVSFTLLLCFFCCKITGQVHYFISEEMRIGDLVGNIAKDMGVNAEDIVNRKLHILSNAKVEFFSVNLDNGNLYINDRIDREELCRETLDCFITFETVVENPLNIFRIKVTIEDINDNPPNFFKGSIDLELSEFTFPCTRFPLDSAYDPDIGSNSLKNYKVNSNPFFTIKEKQGMDGNKYPELVLEKLLDREVQNIHNLVLIAFDGGDPVRSSTMQIKIIVTDFNDNAPVFSSDIYKIKLKENTERGLLALQVAAHDNDEGVNGQITYSFNSIPASARHLFSMDPQSGKIIITGSLDFEEMKVIKMGVEAKDGGGLVSHCKIIVEVSDENDNIPEIKLASITTSISEDSPPGTLVALLNTNDKDSGENGKVTCYIHDQPSLTLESASENYYKLITKTVLDRESASEYNVTVTAFDNGVPPLSTSKTFRIQITDVNDNIPTFEKNSYAVYVPENNHPGASIYTIKAADLDLENNSQITYSILSQNTEDISVLSAITINSETGIIYTQCTFDYEQIREFQVIVTAQDNGLPPLSSNVTLQVFVTDLNDNSPKILYPSDGTDGSVVFEFVPPSSESGYLVTKVVAVDADSGHNAWLSYQVIQATSSGLFNIGLHTGEISTSRSFQERDALKQKVVILVKDHGQPARSATATLNVVCAENMHKALPEVNSPPSKLDVESNMNFYLVITLALISFLFLITVLMMIAKRCIKNTPVLPPENYAHCTLPFPYELHFATDSGKREFPFMEVIHEKDKENNVSANNSALLLMYSEDINTNSDNVVNTEFLYLAYNKRKARKNMVNELLELTI